LNRRSPGLKRNEHLPNIAVAFVDRGDKVGFKRFVIPCAYFMDAAYTIVEMMTRLYASQPEQVNQIAAA
jgi:hypothetical protein